MLKIQNEIATIITQEIEVDAKVQLVMKGKVCTKSYERQSAWLYFYCHV